MFGKLKGLLTKEKNRMKVLAPLEGEVVPVSQVNDPTFSEEILGKGVAILPAGNRVVSPVNGVVSQMFDTGHAVSIISDEGAEVLIHVGLDTIKLKGEHFTIHAHNQDEVKIGDVLMEFDRAGIVAAGYDVITPIVICNSSNFGSFEVMTGKTVKEGEEIILMEE